MKNILLPIFVSFILICFFSCGKDKRYEPKTSDKNLTVRIIRFDKDLIHLNQNNLTQSTIDLYKKYPDIINIYTNEILGVSATDTSKIAKLFREFLSDTVFSQVNQKTLQVFDNVTPIEQNLTASFSILHSFFPEIKLPEVYFFVSGFNRQILVGDNSIGVGVDLFLGSDYSRYQNFTYQYLIKNMTVQQITPVVMSAVLYNHFPIGGNNERLIDNMLYRGKVLFLLSKLLPEELPNTIIGYEKREWEWCRKYEKQVWETIMDRNDLFSTDVMLIHKYMDEAPFTTPVSQEAPGRLGIWVGWQIIESYMKNNKNVNLKDLMLNNNYQQIFEHSGYKP